MLEPTTMNSVARVVADTLREEYGLDPEPLFAAAGLDYERLHEVRGRYRWAGVQQLWRSAVSATGDPCFGLRAGARIRPVTFGVLGVGWLTSATLRESVHRLVRYLHIVSNAPYHLSVATDGDLLWLYFDYPEGALLAPMETVDALFAAVVTMARMVAQPGIHPRQVLLRQRSDGHDATREQFFGCPVVHEATRDGMAFAVAECDAQLVGQETELARESDAAADRFMHALAARPVATGVRRVLLDLLPSGDVTLEQVAVRMKRSLSTLQRQLQQEGATYREVLDDTRRLMAEGYLSNPRLPLSEVAYLLGFEDQSSFSRAFRRWTGSSPRRYREQASHGPPTGARN